VISVLAYSLQVRNVVRVSEDPKPSVGRLKVGGEANSA